MSDPKKTPPPSRTVADALADAAQQLKDSEEAARQVADLCAKATKTARLRRIPHAGVGSSLPPVSTN
jgi:hypothetical protein